MDLLAHYNDDSLNLEDSPSAESETKDVKKADTSLEDEWLSFEKMISDSDKPPGQTESSGSSQYLVHGMVAYPGMSLGSKQISAAPQVEDGKQTDDSSDEDAEEKDNKAGDKEDHQANDDDDAFFKMRKKVKERDRSSSSDRSSDSSRSGSLSPPQLSPVHSENSQHSLPPPDLFDPSEDAHYKSAEHSPEGSHERSPDASPAAKQETEEIKEPAVPERSEPVPDSTEDKDSKQAAKSNDRKSSRDSKSSRRPSHRSRSRSKHRESSRKHRSRSRSKGRRHRHSSKDRHRHRRRKSRDRKRSKSKEKKRSKSREKKTEEKEKNSERRSKSRERKRSKSKDRKRSRSRSKGRERRKSEKERKRSRSKDKERKRRDRSSDRKRRSKSRDRKRRYSRSRSRSRERLRSRSPVYGKKMTFKDKMRKELMKAGKKADDIVAAESSSSGGTTQFSPGELLKASALASLKSNNSSVTPQMALLQTMAVMHQKAQEITGVAVPKYYNPAAVNPLKYAEQVQKRKLLWSKKGDDKEKEKEVQLEGQWKSTQFAADQDGKMTSKFRKLMGMKGGDAEEEEEIPSELSEEQKRKQEELFSRLDKEYEFARMATHTHRGVGLGFSAQVQFPSTQPPH